jgi:hypothetical protein
MLLAIGCASADAGRQRLAIAIDTRDPRLLYDALDGEARAHADTIWSCERQMARVATESYPAVPRDRELARLALAREAASARDFFALALVDTWDPDLLEPELTRRAAVDADDLTRAMADASLYARDRRDKK